MGSHMIWLQYKSFGERVLSHSYSSVQRCLKFVIAVVLPLQYAMVIPFCCIYLKVMVWSLEQDTSLGKKLAIINFFIHLFV